MTTNYVTTEREFWMLIRRALLLMVKAIEKRYLGECKEEEK